MTCEGVLRTPVPDGAHITAFVNDTLMMAQGTTSEEVEVKLKVTHDSITASIRGSGFTLKTGSTEIIMFKRKYKDRPSLPMIPVTGTYIALKNSIKYMGIEVDDYLM